MTTATNGQIGQRIWSYAGVLRDDGLSYGDYVEQLTYMLFLKMAHERTQAPWSEPSPLPEGLDWPSLIARDVDVKGAIYEELLERNAQDVKGGAGQYFTPRPLIQAIVDVIRPRPGETIGDPACGTGGFLLATHDYIARRNPNIDSGQKKHLKLEALHGVDIVDDVVRLCAMNLLLHGVGPTANEALPPVEKGDSLAVPPGDHYEVVLTNPPFGRKSSVLFVNERGEEDREALTVVRDDFWTRTSNKQLNFVQHVYNLLKQNGRAAVVVPDNVLFEGGAGEVARRRLMQQCDVHTLLRLPTGIFYSPGVKANVLFFDRKPGRDKGWTDKLWIYDLRTNMHFTLKTNPLKRADLDDFVKCYNPENRHNRAETWSEDNPQGRWRAFTVDALLQRDKVSLDIFWLRDESLEDAADLGDPDEIAEEIVEDLRAALEEFEAIGADRA